MPTTAEVIFSLWDVNRARTLGKLDEIAKLPNAQEVLGWRPGPGRAHIAWQLMHIGITEELFATERFLGTTPGYPDLLSRFRGGSTPDDEIPKVEQIREVLAGAREHLLKTVRALSESDLSRIPEALKQRGLSIGQALGILSWHEAHHQGQVHITYNLWKAAHGAA